MLSRHQLSKILFCSAALVVAFATAALASGPPVDKAALHRLADFFGDRLEKHRGTAYNELLSSPSPAQQSLNENPDIKLMYVDDRGRPVYYLMLNLNAAKTVSTNKAWPNGGGGFGLTGSTTVLGELGIWDGGGVRTTHQELTGRATQIDSPSGYSGHSTHVAGTMIASGVQSNAKGMSYQGNLACYEWTNDNSEMATAAAAGMKISNHSYGYVTGWYYNSANATWYWYGDTDVSQTEDYFFGFYDSAAQDWDQIARDAPYYTIVVSAGNDRSDVGPGPGGGHYVWDNVAGNWVWSTTTRDPDGGIDGFDCVSHGALAKNVIAVGAVNDIPNGYSSPSDVVMTSFSCWGPTDDGRIKPDFVANGTSLYSSYSTNNVSYATMSGTSMAAPNFSGSLNLLVQYFKETHGNTTPLASTMKAILMQTADEAGTSTGPDYKFGWGLLNTLKAANLIKADSTNPYSIREDSLSNGQSDTLYFTSNGGSPIRLSLAWTDPPGSPPSPSLNPTTIMLVNDLDLRLKHLESSTAYLPYVLNPSSPSDSATTGDDIRDNEEQIYVASPSSGHYMVTISHKGTLTANQWYSLVASSTMTTTAPDLAPPVIAVVRPNGGELFREGTQDTIRWVATDNVGVDSVNIYYSTDSGSTFPHTIATREPNDSSYVWTVPGTLSSTCRVKIVAFDAALHQAADTSDANFTIGPPPDLNPPVVTVVRPNGGELFTAGTQDTIKWIATDNVGVDSVSIYYSTDGGGTYPDTIVTGEPNDSLYVWMVPGTLSSTCRVKIVAYDAALNQGRDTSDANFTIGPPPDLTPPAVTVVRPNGGELFAAGAQDTIRWVAADSAGVDSVSIYYSTDGGTTFPHTIATGQPNDSIYVWTVPGTPSESCLVRIVAYDPSLNIGQDTSDALFTILNELGSELVPEAPGLGLLRAYPNPFNPVIKVEFSIAESTPVRLRIFDINGRVVKTLINETTASGKHSVSWNGFDDVGMPVSSGVYICSLEAGKRTAKSKIVLLK